MNTIFEELGGTYHDENGYLIPDLIVPESPQVGEWGRQYLHHLKAEKRVLYTQLLFSGKLSALLEEVDRHAEKTMNQLMTQMAAQEGVTEQLKAKNQLEWVSRMNSIRSRAAEFVWAELTTK